MTSLNEMMPYVAAVCVGCSVKMYDKNPSNIHNYNIQLITKVVLPKVTKFVFDTFV